MFLDQDKALLKLGYECNNNCIICHAVSNKKYSTSTTMEVLDKIRLCKKMGLNFVVFSGGEPTIRKDIFEIAGFVKDNNMPFGFVTNGRMFSYKEFVRRLVKLNMRYAYVSLHGSNKKTHNAITRTDSFEQTVNGIRNVASYKDVNLIVNIPVTMLNINCLKNIIDIVRRTGASTVKFSFLELKGSTLLNIRRLTPRISEATKRVKEAVNYGEEKGFNVLIGGFPLCLIKNYESKIDELEKHGIRYMSESFEKALFPVDHTDRIKTRRCADCAKNRICYGIDKNYLKFFGDSELEPFETRSNSACFVSLRNIKNIDCSRPFLRWNEVALNNNSVYKIFRYTSVDFSREEIDRMKERGQVYLAARNIDALHSLLKLKESDRCINCKYRKKCGRIYLISKEDVFKKYKSLVESELNKLRGRVLDIGCGELYFYRVFNRLAESRQIEYVGIDPREVKIKNDDMVFIKGFFEDVEFEADCFDNILMLGSYNHIKDIYSSLRKIHSILRPDGRLIVSDSESFIYLGKISKNKNFEHYRNEPVEQVVRRLKKSGFKIIRKIPVSKNSGNCWFIECKKNLYR